MPRRSASASYVPRRLLLPAAAAAAAAAVLAAAGVAATALRSPTELTVATFTLDKQRDVLTRTNLSEYATYHQFPLPDVVVCQDSPLLEDHISLEPDYTCVYHGGVSNSSSEDMRSMSVFVHKSWKTTASRIYKTELCPTDRNTVIFTISRGGATFEIANVDLCGGGRDEVYERVRDQAEAVKTETFDIIQRCDIILGNFNSDLNHFIASQRRGAIPGSKYLTHLKNHLGWTDDIIEAWNTSMFTRLLKNANKSYAHHDGSQQAEITDLAHWIASSAIWFDPERLTQQAFYCFDVRYVQHLGLVARFEIEK